MWQHNKLRLDENCLLSFYSCLFSLSIRQSLKKVNKPKRRLQSLMSHSWQVLTSYFSQNVYDFLTVKTSSKWMHGAARYTGFLPFLLSSKSYPVCGPLTWTRTRGQWSRWGENRSQNSCVFSCKILMLIIGVMESIGGCGSPCGVNVRSPLVMCRPPWWFTGVGSADQLVPLSLV